MRLVFGLVLIAGLALAGFAVYMAQGFLSANQAELERERAARASMVPLVEVFVVNEQVVYGTQLTQEMVRKVRWPEDAIPEGAFLTEEALFPEGGNRLRAALRTMEKDEAVIAVKVTDPGQDAGITSRLSRGMRAFAISTDVSSGVSGFLRPGDTVDIYWSGTTNNSNQQFTKLIEANVKLIAIDQSANTDLSDAVIARTVTVEVNPQQVASLAQAQSTGQLSLSLVGSGDETVAEAIEVDQNSLLGIVVKEEEIVEVEEERTCSIKTRRGAEVVEIPIPCTNG
ncbi:Flp pilus assembly protein CpaB [Algirhabdus cladophorae]|uniref:Flp pilus assembly protein CpaB n=1 Tax=Algirhabdus cladophorae TaxID=3377108 RepID=UPI003B84A692